MKLMKKQQQKAGYFVPGHITTSSQCLLINDTEVLVIPHTLTASPLPGLLQTNTRNLEVTGPPKIILLSWPESWENCHLTISIESRGRRNLAFYFGNYLC